MASQDLWGFLKYLPLTIPYPWHYPISCAFCKCKKHIKIIGISKPSRALHAIWITTLFFHFSITTLLLGVFFVEINLNEPTLSIMQTVFYCLTAAALSGVAAPWYLVSYFIRNGRVLTELMKLENRLLRNEGTLEFRCKQ